jgi:hypothetical protein
MVHLLDLWLPIVLSTLFVFAVSSLIHMFLPVHKGDYKKLPGEESILEAMRAQDVRRGEYMFPCPASMKDMCSPEVVEKLKRGPVGFLTVLPSGSFAMGKNLVAWFLFSGLVGVLVAYTASIGLTRGAATLDVFRLVGSAGILGYAITSIPNSIWKGLSWSITAKFVLDGIVYGLVTAATFAWLWPAA